MSNEMVLEWDEEKRQRNIVEHGIDFVEAVEVLFDTNVSIVPDGRKDYGEKRFNAYGLSNGRRLRMCFTMRGDAVRVITMFKVHNKEWEKYYEKNN
ncbi:MAG: BrnT family toxin [Prevotellaceae bacterium]|jgi:uncharacterized DUF497 family protein|nr:BrnT family toxin [Prevotellaceae bacterium]